MNEDDFIEHDKMELHQWLERKFPIKKFEAIIQAAGKIDEVLLLEEMPKYLCKRSHTLFNGTKMNFKLAQFELKSKIHTIKSAQNVVTQKTIEYLLTPYEPSHNQCKLTARLTFNNSGFGPFDKINFSSPDYAPIINATLLEKYVNELIGVGYRWMSRKVILALRELSQEISSELYSYLYSMLNSTDLMQGFVFACIYDNKDFVLLDDISASSIITLSERNHEGGHLSPIRLALRFISQIVPADDSPIRDACSQRCFVQIQLDSTNPEYYKADQELQEALRAAWGQAVTCYPIVDEGNFLLAAFFPADSHTELVKLLSIHGEKLKDIANKNFSTIKINLKSLEKVQIALNSLSPGHTTPAVVTRPTIESSGEKKWDGLYILSEAAGRFFKGLSDK